MEQVFEPEFNFLARGVKVYELKQEAKSFIVTFPMAYHGGFSYGVGIMRLFMLILSDQFNIGEAVNFAIPDWLKFGGIVGDLTFSHIL